MGERVLSVKVTGEPSGLIAALSESQSAIKKLGSESVTSVGQSKAEFSTLLDTIEKTSPELKGLAQSAAAAGLALDKAGDAKGIGQLTQRLVDAQIKVDQFAAGLEKAAASGADIGEKPVASLAKMQAAVETLRGHLTNLEGATDEAKAKLGLLGEPGQKSLAGLQTEVKNAVSAVKGLEEAGSARSLSRAFTQAEFAAVSLRESIEATARAGGKVDDEAVSALRNLEDAADKAAGKLAKVKDQAGDAAAKAKIQGDAYTTLRGQVGDLDGMFDKMRETGTGATKAIGTVGASIGIMSVAVTGAIAAGKQLAEGIDALSAKYAKLQQAEIDQKVKLQEQEIATRAADRGLIAHGKTIDETVANYNRYAVAQGKLSEGSRKFIETVAGLKIPPTYEDLGKRVDAIGIAFEGAYKRSSEYGDRFLLDNASELKDLAQRYQDLGKEVPPVLQALIDKLGAMGQAGAVAAAGAGQAAEKVMTLAEAAAQAGPSLDGMRERIMDASKAADVSAAINAQYSGEIQKLTQDLNEFGRNAHDQEVWDQNTKDINANADALAANDAALQQQMDDWGNIGKAMGPFNVAVAHATDGYVSHGNAMEDMIQELAKASDEFPRMSMFFGGWIEQLKNGQITVKQMEEILAGFRTGMISYSGMLNGIYGDYDQAINKLYGTLNKFNLESADLWEEMARNGESAFTRVARAAGLTREKLVEINREISVTAGVIDEAAKAALDWSTTGTTVAAEQFVIEITKKKNIR